MIDFGLTQRLTTNQHYETALLTNDMQAGTAGYSPPEQYSRSAKLTPATDVYALAATLYHLLTGRAPVEAIERAAGAKLALVSAFNPKASHHVTQALSRALNLEADARPQSIAEFLQDLQTPTKPVPARFVFGNDAVDSRPEKAIQTAESPEVVAGQILVYMVFAIIALLIVFAFDYVRVVLRP